MSETRRTPKAPPPPTTAEQHAGYIAVYGHALASRRSK